MAAATITGRSTSTLLRPILRSTSARSATTTTRRLSVSTRLPLPTLRSNRISSPSPFTRSVRRELSSFQPVHSAIAAARLVSKLPSEANISTEGRFANYVSPI